MLSLLKPFVSFRSRNVRPLHFLFTVRKPGGMYTRIKRLAVSPLSGSIFVLSPIQTCRAVARNERLPVKASLFRRLCVQNGLPRDPTLADIEKSPIGVDVEMRRPVSYTSTLHIMALFSKSHWT